ncbi:DUF1643 domain-containing protein [Weissella kandleri]|uniref:DUF1643 domain-containing protein n=1 Tax=Weissella kandleri TaxID=1616 RepID=UPI00387E9053
MAKTIEKVTMKLSQKIEGEHIFWKSRQWDSDLPSYFVLSNYPANELLVSDDMTGMLIQNAIFKLGGGGVVVGNLFSKSVGNKANEKILREAYTDNSMDELVTTALKQDYIVISTGALNDKSEISRFRLRTFLERLIDQEANNKIKVLVVHDTKEPAHPLSRFVRGFGLNWQLETLESVRLYERIVKQMNSAKIRINL